MASMKLKNASRILFVNPFGIGDVLFSSVLVSRVKALCPDAHLAFLANRRVETLLRGIKAIDRVWVLERDEWRATWRRDKAGFLKSAWGMFRALQKERYDIVFDLSLSDAYGFWFMLMGVPVRAGFRFRGRGKFLNHALPLNGYADKHVAEYQMDLLGLFDDIPQRGEQFAGAAARMDYCPAVEEKESAERMLRDHGFPDESSLDVLIGIAPGGGESWGRDAGVKRWPPAHYARLIERLRGRGYRAVLLGGSADMEVAGQVQHHLQNECPSFAGRLSLAETAAIMRRCSFLLTNDGGLLHLAVAQDIPTASFFGPTDARVYGPYPRSGRHLVLTRDLSCSPCYKNFRMPPCPFDRACLEQLSVEEAAQRIEQWQQSLSSVRAC